MLLNCKGVKTVGLDFLFPSNDGVNRVYGLLDSCGEVIYIGQSVNMYVRMSSHGLAGMGCCSVVFGEVACGSMNDTEAVNIAAFNPRENRSMPPCSMFKSKREITTLINRVFSSISPVDFSLNGKRKSHYDVSDVLRGMETEMKMLRDGNTDSSKQLLSEAKIAMNNKHKKECKK